MNSLASILYSSASAKTHKRKNLSLQSSSSSSKPLAALNPKSTSKCKTSGMLFRSSTPKTSLTAAVRPVSTSPYSTSGSPRSPRCSTPVFPKQRRTRPFIACELCRQRAFDSINGKQSEKKHVAHHHTTTLVHCQNQTSLKMRHRRSSIEQLLVWIV